MGYINSTGIYVYDEDDLIAPVHTALNLLGGSVTEKLIDYDPVLPQFHTKRLSTNAVAIAATSGFANLAGTNLTVNLPRKALVKIHLNSWCTIGSFSSGTVFLRAGVAVSGATTVTPTEGIPESGTSDWGGVLYFSAGSSGGGHQKSSMRLVELNAGSNTFNIQAYKSSAPVAMSLSYSYYIIEVVRWLD